MKPVTTLAIAAAIAALGLAGAAVAQGSDRSAASQHSEFSAQKKKKAARKRAPVRVRVQPAYRHYHDSSPYPRADEISAPGPGAVRQCRSWLAREYRPSGTVIVPQMRCWWERG
jgi:hypothetical protein